MHAPSFKSTYAYALITLTTLILLAATVAPAAAQPPIDRFAQVCGSDNPFFVTTCYARGNEWDQPALVAFRDTPDNSDHHVLATMRQIGAAYGVAYNPGEQALYVGAYHKRGSPFGPSGGPGTVYRVDLASGDVAIWTEVPGAGRDMHDRSGAYFPDTRARNAVGTVSLGDLDLNEDGTELYVMQMPDQQIFRYRLSDKQLLGRIDIGAAGESWGSQARGMGLKVWRGKLYHGVVHTAYSSQDRSDLAAYIYESDLDGANMHVVNTFSLDYPRGNTFGNVPARWWPWKDGYNSVRPGQLGTYPQPMLSDIDFADNGDMILGLRDRHGDMTFYDPGGANPPGEGTGIPAGDILLSRISGEAWTTTTNPEFFAQDAGPGVGATDAAHDESGFGGLARVQAANRVVTTANSPFRISSGGAYWFDLDSGNNTVREEIYNFESEVNFGKANGLGDVEILCGEEQPTPTPTQVDSPTPPPPPSETPTNTATITPTVTLTFTPTPTQAITVTPTVATPTTTITPTVTVTPMTTVTPTVTVTATVTPGLTPSMTPVPPPTATPQQPSPPPAETPTPQPTSPPKEEQPPEEHPTPTPETPQLPKTGGTDRWADVLSLAGLLFLLLAYFSSTRRLGWAMQRSGRRGR